MILRETIIINGKNHIRTYSDEGRYLIREDGAVYEEAIDVETSGHTYTEWDIIPDIDIMDSERVDEHTLEQEVQ